MKGKKGRRGERKRGRGGERGAIQFLALGCHNRIYASVDTAALS